ncbi:MAG: hypothetical protein AAB557_03550 [Patescibacteria group bacterium]
MNKFRFTPLLRVGILISALLMSACGVAPWASKIDRANATATALVEEGQGVSIVSTAAAQATAMAGGQAPASGATQSGPGATAGPSTTSSGYCPTRREVNDWIFGLNADKTSKDVVVQLSTESCAWQVNTGNPTNYFSATLPTGKGLIATIHRLGASKAEVYVGDGKKYDLFRGTFRFAGGYAQTDDMNAVNAAVRILVKENVNGTYQFWLDQKRIQDWTFTVLAGNFSCPTDICPAFAPAATFAPAAPVSTAVSWSCPLFAGVLTNPGTDGTPYCKYVGPVVTDKVPAGWKAQYWNGKAVQYAEPGAEITSGEITFRQK